MNQFNPNRRPITWDHDRGVYLLDHTGQPIVSVGDVGRWAAAWAWLRDQALNIGLVLGAVAIIVLYSWAFGGGQ